MTPADVMSRGTSKVCVPSDLRRFRGRPCVLPSGDRRLLWLFLGSQKLSRSEELSLFELRVQYFQEGHDRRLPTLLCHFPVLLLFFDKRLPAFLRFTFWVSIISYLYLLLVPNSNIYIYMCVCMLLFFTFEKTPTF